MSEIHTVVDHPSAERSAPDGRQPGPRRGPERATTGEAGTGVHLLRRFLRSRAGAVGFFLTASVALAGLLAGPITDSDPQAMAYPTFLSPSGRFLMGTDAVGRDVFSRVVHGVGTSLTFVVSVVVISTLIGVAVGLVSGYFGGLVDSLLMRVVDLMQSVPWFILAILVIALLGQGTGKLILFLGLTSWTFLARLVRAEVLSVKRRDFVEAARALGAPGLRVLLRHVLPNVVPAVIAVLPLLASRLVLIESGLSFLGLTDPGRVSLGFLVFEAQPHLQYYWWLSVFPGLTLVALVLGLNLMGDALNAVIDPLAPKSMLAPSAAPGQRRWRRQGADTPSPVTETADGTGRQAPPTVA